MNRNNADDISEISALLSKLKQDDDIKSLFRDIFTKKELETLSKRWQILKLLSEGRTQREIAEKLHVSLCKVTRGAKILKNKQSVITKHMIKEKL